MEKYYDLIFDKVTELFDSNENENKESNIKTILILLNCINQLESVKQTFNMKVTKHLVIKKREKIEFLIYVDLQNYINEINLLFHQLRKCKKILLFEITEIRICKIINEIYAMKNYSSHEIDFNIPAFQESVFRLKSHLL
jgi:hypothetical protein